MDAGRVRAAVGESGQRRRHAYWNLFIRSLRNRLPVDVGRWRVEVRYRLAATCLLIARNTSNTPSPLMAEARMAVDGESPSKAARSMGGVAPGRSDLLHSSTTGKLASDFPCPASISFSSASEAMFSAVRSGAESATKTMPSTPCSTAVRAPDDRGWPGTV